MKTLEAEAAQGRRAVAQMEATLKKEKASWVSELDMQKYEVRRQQHAGSSSQQVV